MEIFENKEFRRKFLILCLNIFVLGGIGLGAHYVVEAALDRLNLIESIKEQDKIFKDGAAEIVRASLPGKAFQQFKKYRKEHGAGFKSTGDSGSDLSAPGTFQLADEVKRLSRPLSATSEALPVPQVNSLSSEVLKFLSDPNEVGQLRELLHPQNFLAEVVWDEMSSLWKLPNGLGKWTLLSVYGFIFLATIASILSSMFDEEPWEKKVVFTGTGFAALILVPPLLALVFKLIGLFIGPLEACLIFFLTLCLFAGAALVEEKLGHQALTVLRDLLKLPNHAAEEAEQSDLKVAEPPQAEPKQ